MFYRLNGAQLHLPALRVREDRGALIDQLWRAQASGTDVYWPGLSAELRAALLQHPWPGNIRQLQSVLQYVAATCTEPVATLAHLPQKLLPVLPELGMPVLPGPAGADAPGAAAGSQPACADLMAALRLHRWCVSHAARALKMSRSTLHRKMKALGIVSPNRT